MTKDSEVIKESLANDIYNTVIKIPKFMEQFHILIDAQSGDEIERLATEFIDEDSRQRFADRINISANGDEKERHKIYRDFLHLAIDDVDHSSHCANIFNLFALYDYIIVSQCEDVMYTTLTNIDDKFVLLIHTNFIN